MFVIIVLGVLSFRGIRTHTTNFGIVDQNHLQRDGKIAGGYRIRIEEYPYQLSIQFLDTHICGATLLTPSRAVTAAHCTYEYDPFDLSIHGGTTKLYEKAGQSIRIAKMYEHPRFDLSRHDYDVSVLVLARPFLLNVAVQPIPLAETAGAELLGDGALCTTSGWGALSYNTSPVEYLRAVDVPFINANQCRKLYNKRIITDRMVCFGYSNGEMDACKGDSGGPLVCEGFLVGITSWGERCAQPRQPGVYTKISQGEISSHIIKYLN